MLQSKFYPANSQCADSPLLVFVHGLLGSGDDWLPVIRQLNDFSCLTVDLPGHGRSVACQADGFTTVCEQISITITGQLSRQELPADTPVVLIGYSLGARLVMYGLAHGCFSDINLRYGLLEGGNFGLSDQQQREARLENDRCWAERFRREPLSEVLADWYRQPVFASLNRGQREQLVAKRAANQGGAVANMLLSTSLARQPLLLEQMKSIKHVLHYVCGEQDSKFYDQARKSGLSYSVVQQAGHNVHHECPEQFARLIRNKLTEQVQLE